MENPSTPYFERFGATMRDKTISDDERHRRLQRIGLEHTLALAKDRDARDRAYRQHVGEEHLAQTRASKLDIPSEPVPEAIEEKVAKATFRASFSPEEDEATIAEKWREWPEEQVRHRRFARAAIKAMQGAPEPVDPVVDEAARKYIDDARDWPPGASFFRPA